MSSICFLGKFSNSFNKDFFFKKKSLLNELYLFTRKNKYNSFLNKKIEYNTIYLNFFKSRLKKRRFFFFKKVMLNKSVNIFKNIKNIYIKRYISPFYGVLNYLYYDKIALLFNNNLMKRKFFFGKKFMFYAVRSMALNFNMNLCNLDKNNEFKYLLLLKHNNNRYKRKKRRSIVSFLYKTYTTWRRSKYDFMFLRNKNKRFSKPLQVFSILNTETIKKDRYIFLKKYKFIRKLFWLLSTDNRRIDSFFHRFLFIYSKMNVLRNQILNRIYNIYFNVRTYIILINLLKYNTVLYFNKFIKIIYVLKLFNVKFNLNNESKKNLILKLSLFFFRIYGKLAEKIVLIFGRIKHYTCLSCGVISIFERIQRSLNIFSGLNWNVSHQLYNINSKLNLFLKTDVKHKQRLSAYKLKNFNFLTWNKSRNFIEKFKYYFVSVFPKLNRFKRKKLKKKIFILKKNFWSIEMKNINFDRKMLYIYDKYYEHVCLKLLNMVNVYKDNQKFLWMVSYYLFQI